MKKTTFLVSVLLFAFLLCSCRTPASYKYMNDEEEIKRIEIVKIFFDEQRELNQETLNVVEQTEVFIKKFIFKFFFNFFTRYYKISVNSEIESPCNAILIEVDSNSDTSFIILSLSLGAT